MKPKTDKLSHLLCLLPFLCACESVKQITIEVQEPAPITLPVSAQNVLILNNALPQPENYRIEQYFEGKSIADNYPISLDSAVWNTTQALSDVLSKSDFFNTVSTYKVPIRTDNEWLSVQPLPKEIRDEFHEIEDYQALITIDRLLFIVKTETKRNMQDDYTTAERFVFSDTRVAAMLTCSIYLYGRNEPLTTFSISDSLISRTTISNNLPVIVHTVSMLMLKELSYQIGESAALKFIPTWKTTDRILFTNHKARIKEAYSYVTAHNWSAAESIWLSELEKENKPLDKAHIALNIAVTNEMQDKLNTALQWAQKSKEYYNLTKQIKPEELHFIDKYISELQKRIQDNHLLDIQTGKSEF
jgi:hypothetical protein